MFNLYPYTDFHEINLDWIIRKIKELGQAFNDFEAVNKITNAGAWDITKQYQAWTVVSDNNIGYISLKPVPVGVAITNTEYWGVIADYDILITNLSARISALETFESYVKEGFVTPEMFGAAGDGVTDDTAAVTEAFTHLNVVCPGSYLVSDNIKVSSSHIIGGTFTYHGDLKLFEIQNACHIECMTVNSDYGNTGEAQFSIFYSDGIDDIIIEHCNIINSKGEGVAIYNGDRCKISHNYITNCYDNGIVVGGTCDNNTIEENIIDGTTNQNCIFLTASPGSTATADTANNNIISGNRCSNFGDSGIESGIGTRGTVISDNTVTGTNSNPAILIRDAKYVKCVNNNIDAVYGIGIVAQYEDATFKCENVISDNTVSATALGINTTMAYNDIIGNYVTSGDVGIRSGGNIDGIKVNDNTVSATNIAIQLNYVAAATTATGECKRNGVIPNYYNMNCNNMKIEFDNILSGTYARYTSSTLASIYAGALEVDITITSPDEHVSHAHVSFISGHLALSGNTSDIVTTDVFDGWKVYMDSGNLRIQRRGADITGVTIKVHVRS